MTGRLGNLLASLEMAKEKIDDAVERADREHARWLAGLQEMALAVGCRVAIASRPKQIIRDYDIPLLSFDLMWKHVLLMPGEKPPAKDVLWSAWTVYEHRADIGWMGRSV